MSPARTIEKNKYYVYENQTHDSALSSALTLEKNKHEVGENLTEDRPAFFSSVRAEDIINGCDSVSWILLKYVASGWPRRSMLQSLRTKGIYTERELEYSLYIYIYILFAMYQRSPIREPSFT